MKENSALKKRVGIWIRGSTEDQARGESPQHHEARAREYAKFNEWTVVEVYDLAGVSGKTVMENAEAKRLHAGRNSRGHGGGFAAAHRSGGYRNYEPARDHGGLAPRERETGLQRDCVAGYARGSHGGGVHRKRRPGSLPRQDWTSSGDLFQRPQDSMDS